MKHLLACVLMLCGSLQWVQAQGTDGTREAVRVAGPFEEASEIRVDGTQRYWVLDRGAAEVWTGAELDELLLWGGSASTELRLPRALFVSSGLTVWISDGGSQTVASYSRRGRLISARAVPRLDGSRSRLVGQVVLQREGKGVGLGEPGPVAVDLAGDLLLFERGEGVFQQWDASGRVVAVQPLSELELASVRAVEPVADGWIVLGERRAVRMDSFLEPIASATLPGACRPAAGLTERDGRTTIVGGDGICFFDAAWALETAEEIQLGSPLRDAVYMGDTLFLLTARYVWRLE